LNQLSNPALLGLQSLYPPKAKHITNLLTEPNAHPLGASLEFHPLEILGGGLWRPAKSGHKPARQKTKK